MGKNKRIQKVLGVLMMVFMLIGMIPGIAIADSNPFLGSFIMTPADSTLIAGDATNINIRLYNTFEEPFSGSVSATIIDPSGDQTKNKTYSISGSNGNYVISNVTLDTPGDYTFTIATLAPYDSSVGGHIKVVNAVSTVTGSLLINTNNTLSVKVSSDENPLIRKSVTVDGTKVGVNAQSYTTLSDGTFTFYMTPTLYGTVSITYAGHVIGTIPVVPAYTQNSRIGGDAEDNVALSIEIAKSGWIQGTRNVILARDDQFSDALAAAPFSKKLDAPILMTDSGKLDDRMLAEIRSLGATNVYIVGGTVAISQGIEDSLRNEFVVTRLAGQQACDTAALISANVGIEATHTVYLANAYAIPDAIAISAFAAEQGSPILLTDRDQLPASTIQALTDLKVTNVVLLGGTAVIGTSVETQLNSKYSVKRWGGYDRYDTQSIIFQNLFTTQIPQSPLYFTSGLVRQDDVSSGKSKADALLTAALAAKNGGFVAMLPLNNLPSSMNYFLLYNKGYISKTAVVGNNSGVSHDLEQQLQQMLNR